MVNNELYHYGVLGMKWGVRRARQKEEYGLTKKEVKKKIREAKKNYRRKEDPTHTFSGVTGKNWAKVRSQNEKEVENNAEIKELRAKRDKAYAAAEAAKSVADLSESYNQYKNKHNNSVKDTSKSKTNVVFELTSDILQEQGDHYASKVNARVKEIGEKYTKKYQDALLKDIGYEDLDLGRQMLNDYNIKNNWGKYNG